MEQVRPKELNKDVRAWARQSRSMMEQRVRMLTNKNKHVYLKIQRVKGIRKGENSASRTIKLADSIKSKVTTRFGIAERIVFPFAKHGIFISLGASRGHAAKSNPRKTIEWYNFVLEERLENLADMVMENYADATMNVSGIGKKA